MRIVVRQISGLGNQLFQYAAGRYYSRRYNARMEVAVDPARNAFSYGYPRPFLLSHFSIEAPCRELNKYDRLICGQRPSLGPVQTLLKKMSGTQVVRETIAERYRFHQDLPLQNEIRTVYLVGYWQAHRSRTMWETNCGQSSLYANRQKQGIGGLEQIRQSKSPVSLHVRRGDKALDAEGNIDLAVDYYCKGIRFFEERLEDPTFFVFSDEMAFARQNLPRDARFVFVDHNDSYSAHEDLRLMASCRGHASTPTVPSLGGVLG